MISGSHWISKVQALKSSLTKKYYFETAINYLLLFSSHLVQMNNVEKWLSVIHFTTRS